LSPPANAFLVARHEQVMYVRAVGLSNMKNAMVLEAFLSVEATAEIHTVCVDLSACTGMDSTFMGLLVASASRIRPHGGKLVVVNPTEGNLKLLRLLGLVEVLPVLQGCELPELEFVKLSCTEGISQRERMKLVQRAHQHLTGLNDANKAKFAAFLAALELDLAKLERKDAEAAARVSGSSGTAGPAAGGGSQEPAGSAPTAGPAAGAGDPRGATGDAAQPEPPVQPR
jgi:anti-sigma B factor antagonist